MKNFITLHSSNSEVEFHGGTIFDTMSYDPNLTWLSPSSYVEWHQTVTKNL